MKSSLTLWDASSSQTAPLRAFWITAVFLPIVLICTRWVYKVIWGSVMEARVRQDSYLAFPRVGESVRMPRTIHTLWVHSRRKPGCDNPSAITSTTQQEETHTYDY